MKKEKTPKTNAMRILERAKIPYKVMTYPWKEDALDAVHAAAAMGRRDEEVYKTLLAQGDKTGVLVAIIPSNAHIDLKHLAKASGNKRVEMLPLKDLTETTGYVRGGCSPLGMKKDYPTYIDEQVLALAEVGVSAGQRGLQMALAPADLIRVAKMTVAPLVQKEEA